MCQNWLAVERGDGKTQRELFVACEPQKSELKFLLRKQVQHYIMDKHLWFSVLFKPVQSSFTRLDRVTCCFLFQYLSMLVDIVYFEKNANSGTNFIDFGLFNITIVQVNHL